MIPFSKTSRSLFLRFAVLLVFLGGIASSAVGQLRPDDPSIADNLLVWLTDPGSTYQQNDGVWLDSSGNENNASTFVGARDGVEFAPLELSTESVEEGLFAGQDIDFLLSADGFDGLRTPSLNGGVGFEELTFVVLSMYGNAASLNRHVGIGSFHDDDLRSAYHLAADGSIRKDNGNVPGTIPIPEDFFVRGSVLADEGFGPEVLDLYIDDLGVDFNLDLVPFDSPGTADDRLYVSDLREDFADNRIVQVAFFDAPLSEEQVTGIAEWMIANPNTGSDNPPVLAPTGPVCNPDTGGDIDGNGAVEFADFLTLSANFGTDVESHEFGDLDCDGSVAFSDFLILSDNFGSAAGAASVPEPSTSLLAAMGMLCVGLLRHQRKN